MEVMARLLLLLLLASCTYVSQNPNVMVNSEPQGAEILVDGEPTGRNTPAMLELDDDTATHTITLRKMGFAEESRTVFHYAEGYTSRWDDGAVDTTLLNLPLWWTLGDMLTPFAVRYLFVPHDLMVRLYPEGEAPVSGKPPPADPITGAPGAVDLLTGSEIPIRR
jgi:hypothetical protein